MFCVSEKNPLVTSGMRRLTVCASLAISCAASAQPPAASLTPESQAVLGHIDLTAGCLPARPPDAANVVGTSVLIATVTLYGTLGTAAVLKSSGSSDLDNAAAESVKQCPVRTGRDRWGRPLESRVLIVINWKEQGPGEAGSLLALNLASNPQCAPNHPARATDERPTGPTRVAMQVEEGGALSAVAVAQSSGSTRLDGAAMNAVASCALKPRPFTDSHLSGPALAFTLVRWVQ